MTQPTIPTDEQLAQIEPDDESVVAREEDEGVSLEVYVISGSSSRDTSARTYTRAFGHYFVSSNSDATTKLDDLFAEFTSDNGILSSFRRPRHEAYEVIVEVRDVLATDAEFSGMNEVSLEIPSHSEHIETVDEFLDEVRSDVKDN